MAADVREEVEAARSAWLLMGKGYRISRSIRLQWFFQHLNTVVSPKPQHDIVESSEELEVLSVIKKERNPSNQSVEEPSNTNSKSVDDGLLQLRIVPTTRLSFIARQYRFAYCIDMSPSLATVDTQTGDVLVDNLYNNLKNSLTGLVQPFTIENSSLTLSPRIYITVLAHTYTNEKECQVLMQGFCLNKENVHEFLCKLRWKLKKLCDRLINGITRKKVDAPNPSAKNQSSQTSLFYMIRDSLLALHLLPDNASAAIVVITDGVFLLENAYVTDALLAQCRNSTAVVSFLQVGSGYGRASVELGFVPHCALMQFIATATSGAYLVNCPRIKECEMQGRSGMNIYHKSLLCWNFQRDLDRTKVISHMEVIGDITHLFTWGDVISFSSDSNQQSLSIPPQPQQTMRYMELDLRTKISSLLSLRAREGYITDGIKINHKQDHSRIEVKLVWPWKEHVTIEYIAKANWSLGSVSNQTHVVVNVTGPYEFLVDITSQKPKTRKNPLRKIVLQRFEHTMKSLELSDNVFVQLQSFSFQESASKIPETIAKGSPLFCIPANSSHPVLALQYGGLKIRKSTKSPDAHFANFWRPIVTMDTRTWSKWFHCHRISILLEHDRPILKDLFVPTTSGQYSIIQCRAAISSFNRMLKEWCDFILLENHSYVKFMSNSPDERPYTFCVLRLTFKGICIILKLAFLLGTPGIERSKVTEDLKVRLSNLKAVIEKWNVKEDSSFDKHGNQISQRVEQPCIVFMTKQFERILVKYESVPDEVRSCGQISHAPEPTVNEKENMRPYQMDTGTPGAVLGQYLFNQRWVWSMGPAMSALSDVSSISQILGTIMRQRLYEGFHFCSNGKGIVTMAKEVGVTVSSSEENMSNCCIIQYVIFPPHSQLLMKPSGDFTESDHALHEVDGDLQMVIEIWIEPQLGTIDEEGSPLSYLHGEVYNKIPEKMFAMDAKMVMEISSYMMIHRSCFNKIVNEKMPDRGTQLPVIPTDTFASKSVVHIPFLFEVVPLLHKSKLVVSLYPMMRNVKQDVPANKLLDPNEILLGYLFNTLGNMNDVYLPLKPEENASILALLKERCCADSAIWKENKPLLHFSAQIDSLNFKCFLKSFGSSIIILVVPTTMRDVNAFLDEEETENDVKDRQRSNVPFFIFECEYDTMKTVQALLQPQYKFDVLQDYTEALNESELVPRHINQKIPEDRTREIVLYCQGMYDHYFWALVSGVYDCLKHNFVLHPDDVESSIELFCEESTKEIDVTSFLRTLCSHYRSNTLIVDQFAGDDVVFPDNNISTHMYPENKSLSRLQKRSSSGSSSFRSSKTSLKLRNGECDNIPLAEEIKRLFIEILSRYFEHVPNDQYYMFFKDQTESTGIDSNVECDLESQDTSSARSSVTTLNREILHSSDNNLSSGPESDHQPDDDVIYINTHATKDQERPMFLHLTCSVHYKTAEENIMKPISVTSLPTCLGDIFNQLSDNGRQIDPYSELLTVTLDLICLSQPTEPEEDDEWKAPKEVIVQRQRSSDSIYSSQGSNSTRGRRSRLPSSTSRDESFIRQASDSIENLPKRQRVAVEKACEDIEWLLEDEIASAFRTQPITEENLDRIAKHIRNSLESQNCILEKKDFNFVTGLEKVSNHCLPMFIVELEDTNLDYNLKRVGKYYCVVGNPILEEESDVESLNMDEVKEKAKLTRKTFGKHRRSQSDFTNSKSIETVKLDEKKTTTRRCGSWPLVYDRFNEDAHLIYIMEQGISITEGLWNQGSDMHFHIRDENARNSSKGNSSASPNPRRDNEILQRSMSYSEYQKEDTPSQHKRRHYSLPNIHKPERVEDKPLVAVSDSDDVSDDSHEHMDTMLKPFRPLDKIRSQSHKDFTESVVYEDDQMLAPHPQFWLFMQISEESVNVYLHHRQTELIKNVENHKSFYNRLLDHMDQICKIVNQRSLLDHLYNTFTVHSLLLAEDEERLWNPPDNELEANIVIIKTRDSATTPFGSVVHGEYKFQPGFFECDIVWQQSIAIHNRLSMASNAGGMSKAMLAVRSVLQQFQAQNRDNVFVIKEKMNNVVYIRLSQGPSDRTRLPSIATAFDEDDDRVFRPVHDEQSRASSTLMLAPSKQDDDPFDRIDFERQDSFHSAQFMTMRCDDKSSTSENFQQQDYIFVSVYGIREPGPDIKVEVLKLIMKKLESTTLDLINQQIARNPKCKLTPQDVEFIQPAGEPPTKQLKLCVSAFAWKYLHAIMFYFHQHLLKKYNMPRYTTDDPQCHFKNYANKKELIRSATETNYTNNIYLYNRREKSEIGIGIIHLTLVDQDGKYVIVQPCYPLQCYTHYGTEELKQTLDQLLKIKQQQDVDEDDCTFARNSVIEINIWQKGEINIESFEDDLLKNLKNALYDSFLEFYLLYTPICDIPQSLQLSHSSSGEPINQHRSSFSHMRSSVQSSSSSNATTPKFGKPVVVQGKGNFSQPGTPIESRAESPQTKKITEDLKLVSEIASSIPKDSLQNRDSSPSETFQKNLGENKRRDSPSSLRDSPFARKDSPSLHRKLSGRENSPMLRKRSASSRTSSIRSENELIALPNLDSPISEGDPPKTISMCQLNQMKTSSYVMVTDPEVTEVIGELDPRNKKTTWQDLEIQRRWDVERSKERRKHEHGLKGNLHPNYYNSASELFDCILEHNNVSVHKHEGYLRHNYSMETIMDEFIKDIHERSPDIKPKAFKSVVRYVEGVKTSHFVFISERIAVKTTEQGESSMEHEKKSVAVIPGESCEYIVIGHNSHKWLLSMGTDEEDLSDDEEGKSSKEHNGKQHFNPLHVHNPGHSAHDRRQFQLTEHPSCITHAFVPRQKFFIATFKEKQISLYTYNFSTEASTTIGRQLKRLYAWHNVRTHLNACLYTQKLGLFHHKLFVRDCPGKEDPDVSSFAGSSNRSNLIPLIKEVSPVSKDKHKPDNIPAGVPIPDFDETFRDIVPPKPIRQCPFFAIKDLVKRQAWQYQDVRNVKLHIAYQEARLKDIFEAWKQEGAHVPITEDKLHLLRRRSYFVHYCDAPVMFKDYDVNGQEMYQTKNVLVGLEDNTGDSMIPSMKMKDDWFEELKWALVQQYIQYLQTLGLCVVQVTSKPTTKSSGHTNRMNYLRSSRSSFVRSTEKETHTIDHRPTVYYLQKTTNGGIILMNVFFKRNNLCYKMSAFQLASISNMSHYITTKDQRQFFEECNKFKDLTHLRSFTYDFHIREIQNHLSGRHSRFNKSYPVHNLMELILAEYPKPPRFCRCILADGFVSIPCTPGLVPSTVYDYLVLNGSVYDLSKIPANMFSESASEGRDHVLTYSYNTEKEPIQFPESWRTRRDKTEYDGNVTIHFKRCDENSGVINLPYFVCLGNKKEFYPRPHMLSNVSSLKRRERVTSSMDTSDGDSGKIRTRVRFSGASDSLENITPYEVQSTGSIRRIPSWSAALVDGTQSGNTLRTTESDTGISSARNIFSPRFSPGKSNVFRMSPDQHLSGGSPDSDASTETLAKRLSLPNTTQETYFINELKFVNQEILRVRENLNKRVSRCLSNCWRDLLWHRLLISDTNMDDDKKLKKKSSVDPAAMKLSALINEWEAKNIMDNMTNTQMHLTYNTMKRLIALVQKYKMEEIEERISESYFYLQSNTQRQLIRNLLNKYGPHCRRLISEEGDQTYLCILNASYLDMFYLVDANESTGILEFSVIFRCKPVSSPLECKEEDVLTPSERAARKHIESVNTCLCYNLWLQLLLL